MCEEVFVLCDAQRRTTLIFYGILHPVLEKKTVEKTDNNTHCSLDILTFEFRSQFWMTSVTLAPCFYPQLQQGDQRRTGNAATLISASILLLFYLNDCRDSWVLWYLQSAVMENCTGNKISLKQLKV